jgi:chromosome segregation protein
MFFKRIEITGFKSFANRTDILFKPGVTVIVGPNGCGKSNIFDAVRWVLGEQSAKSLRGHRMGDVIFVGSETHRATAFAQVAITVSNEDRRLPIDFNEVVIARRLLRTGESEYSINRHPCRLRDVIELFMDTGVGTNAYSIMEQGRIDQIINARPIDRREIFEEAAGVSKYRARRAEAQRRLQRTDEDLVRLADIIAEVKRQAGSLKRQASRAERYKRLAGELQGLEMRLLAHRWRLHQEEGRGLADELAAVEDRLAQVSARLAQLEAQHAEGLTRTEELNRQILDLTAETNAKSAAIHETEHRAGLLRQRTEINTERLEQLDAEIERHGERLDVVSADLERLGRERFDREAAFTEREHAHAARRAESERLRAGLDKSERDLAQLRRELSERRTEQLNLDNEIRLAALMGERLREEIGVLQAQREEESRRVEAAQAALAEREEAQGAEEARLGELSERQETIDSRLSDLADEEREVTEATEACHSDLGETGSRLRALRALQASFEGYLAGVRLVMQAAEAGELQGLLGTFASQVQADRDHETAIEAALAGDEQVIIARTAQHRDAAVAWLRSRGEGRATILALDAAREPRRADEAVLAREDVIAWADQVVHCEDAVRPAVRDLLGDTLIVTDLEAALRLSADGTARRCVTPEGELAIGGARVTGGRLQRSGLLTREREIADLAVRAERLEREVADLRHRRGALAASRAEIEAERQDLATLRQRQAIRCAEMAKDLEMARRDARAAEDARERLSRRIADLETQAESQLDLRAGAADRLDETRADIASLEDEMKSAEGQSETTGVEARRLAEEVQALAIEVARAREQLETLRLRHESAEAEHGELKRRIATAERERKRLIEENEESAKVAAQLEESLRALFDERRLLEARVAEQRCESDQASIDLRRLAQEIHVVTRERNELQNRHGDLLVRRGQHEMQLQQCDAEAGEKFRTPMSDILAAHPDPVADPAALRSSAAEIRERMDAMGPVNVIAIEEYQQLRERQDFLTSQEYDLLAAKRNLEKTISELDRTTAQIFTESLAQIRVNFQAMFRRLFGGGRADLIALEPDNLIESGIEIIAQPPGKKLQSISLLSGGEKALTAISLLFGIFMLKPAPFCVLDEIDAPLDDKNIGRFKGLLAEFSQTTQFIIITHNKLTMELADTLFGITMEEPGVSRLVGVDIHTAQQYAA